MPLPLIPFDSQAFLKISHALSLQFLFKPSASPSLEMCPKAFNRDWSGLEPRVWALCSAFVSVVLPVPFVAMPITVLRPPSDSR